MMTMAPGIEAAASPHGRAAAAAAAAAAAWYQQTGYPTSAEAGTSGSSPSATSAPSSAVMPPYHPAAAHQTAAGLEHAGHPAGSAAGQDFFASSAEASRYYQMHYESAASQGKYLYSCRYLMQSQQGFITACHLSPR